MLNSKTKKQPQEVFIHIVHSKRLKPLKKQPAVKCVQATGHIDQQYLAELAGSEEYISIAFCYKNYNEEANPRLSSAFHVRSIPTLVLMNKSNEIARISGALRATELQQWLDQQLNAQS